MASDHMMRASDLDRDAVVATLRDAYTAGRLTLEEFDERMTAAYLAAYQLLLARASATSRLMAPPLAPVPAGLFPPRLGRSGWPRRPGG